MTKKKQDEKVIETRFLPVEDREDVDQKYEAIVAYCQHFNTTFRDGEFPVEDFPKKKKKKGSKLKRALRFISGPYQHDVKWTRPTQFRRCFHLKNVNLNEFQHVPVYEQSDEWKLWNDPTIEDVCQRSIGDCGLIAVMGSLVEFPGVLEALFPRKEVSEYGVYEVRLCVFGVWKSILVDDWFMTRNNFWSVSYCIGFQLWASFIEKACAKVYGGYLKICGINVAECFPMLTGHPTTVYSTQDIVEDRLFKMLISAKSTKFPMCANSPTQKNELMERLGVRPRHYFSLIDVKLWRGCRLVRVRNNRGNKRWKSEWSFEKDSGKVLNKKDKKKLNGRKGRIVGTCWIELKHFMQCFTEVIVCRLRPSWTSITVNTVIGGNIDNRTKAIQIVVPETTEMCFSLECPTDHQILANTLLCLRRFETDTGDVGDIVHCFFIYCSSSTEDVYLEPGTYLLIVTNIFSWVSERNVGIHSSKPVHARLVPLNATVLTDSFQQFVHIFGNEIPLNRHNPKVSIKKCWISDILFVMLAENYSKDEHLHVRVYLEKGTRLFIRHNDTDFSDKQVDVVPPMSRQIILAQCEMKKNVRKSEEHIHVEYHLSLENIAKVWRKTTQHYPPIDSTLYFFHTLAIEENE